MSCTITVTISCDGVKGEPCPESRYIEGASVKEAEQQARAAGWLCTARYRRDLCPECRPSPSLGEALS